MTGESSGGDSITTSWNAGRTGVSLARIESETAGADAATGGTSESAGYRESNYGSAGGAGAAPGEAASGSAWGMDVATGGATSASA